MIAEKHKISFLSLQTVLLGDAAHTMSPVLGQGLNAGLEDVAVFADCLQQHHGNVDTALPAYNTRRLPDVQAIMTVNEVVASSDVGLSVQVHCVCLLILGCLSRYNVLDLLACHACLPFPSPLALSACRFCLPFPLLLPFLLAFLLACLLARVLACLPSFPSLPFLCSFPSRLALPACLSACVFAFLLAFLPFCLPISLPACLACLAYFVFFCLLDLLACLLLVPEAG